MTNPRVLLLDEVSLGLAPIAVEQVYDSLRTVIASGATIVLVEQDLDRALQVATRVVCMLEGRIVLKGRRRLYPRADHRSLFRLRRGVAGSLAVQWVNQVLQGVLLGGYYALIACGLSFMFGVMRVINLAHGSLAIVAAYLVWALAERLGNLAFPGPLGRNANDGVRAVGYCSVAVLERSLRSGQLVPLLSTFGLAVVIDNLLFEKFGADTRSLAPNIGDLAFESWNLTDDIAAGQLRPSHIRCCRSVARRPASLSDVHLARSRDKGDDRRSGHRRTGRHQLPQGLCDRRRDCAW